MRDEGRVPTSPIKPRPRPSGTVVLQRVRRTRRREGSGGRAGGLPPLPPRPRALPRPLPRAHRRSYRNSAGSQCRDAPHGGPGEPGREGGPRRSGKRGKGRNSRNKPLGENQTNRVRAGRAQPPGRGRVWGPGSGGRALGRERALRLGGSGLGGGGEGAPRPGLSSSAGLLVTRHPGPGTDGSPAPEAGAPPSAPPRPEPQIAAGCRGGAVGPGAPRRVGAPHLRASRGRPGPRSRGVGSPRAGGGGPRGPAPPGRCPPPARPAPSFPAAPTPRPGSSTQTFRPARSLLRARRLPLQPGSFRTFRPAPSPRPPFPGPPRSSLGPGGAAWPERPPELGPGKPGGRQEEALLGEVVWLVGSGWGWGGARGGLGPRAIVQPEPEPRIRVPGSLEGRGESSPGSPAHPSRPPATRTSWSREVGEPGDGPRCRRLSHRPRVGCRGRALRASRLGGLPPGSSSRGARARALPPFGLRLALSEPARPQLRAGLGPASRRPAGSCARRPRLRWALDGVWERSCAPGRVPPRAEAGASAPSSSAACAEVEVRSSSPEPCEPGSQGAGFGAFSSPHFLRALV